MPPILRAIGARVLGFARPTAPALEFDEELDAHLAMAVEERMRAGISPAD
jgi:hypothetical protein